MKSSKLRGSRANTFITVQPLKVRYDHHTVLPRETEK